MVRDRWYVVLETGELPRKGALGVVRFGRRLAFWRDEAGTLRCVDDDCPHRGAALSQGRIVDGCLECPYHGFRFDKKGQCTHIPAHGQDRPIPKAMRTRAWPVREDQGFVWLWLGEDREQLPPLPFFDDLREGYAWAGATDDWDTDWTRAMETQLDFTHLPFVHQDSIGKKVPHRLEVDTQVDGDRILIRYAPETYDAKDFLVEVRNPGLWRNQLTPGVWGFLAFVPVREGQCRVYLRFYQNKLTLPVLGTLFSALSNLYNLKVLNEDKVVALTQEPRKTWLRMGETLLPSDRPIIAFRRWLDTQPHLED